ncbi:MAG: TlpA disulfide reductase family protein [Thiobacillaceae bacterium]
MALLTMEKMKFYPTHWLAGMLLGLIALTAHAFTLTDTEGKTHKLADYKGKWVLVNFWATWCPPCLEEIPDLVALHEDKRNNLVVIGIAMDYRNAKQVMDFAESMLVSYPIVLGSPTLASQIGPVDGLPTTYLYNPAGKLVAHQVGGVTKEAVEDYIQRIAKKGGK